MASKKYSRRKFGKTSASFAGAAETTSYNLKKIMIIFFSLSIILTSCNDNIVIENDYFKYEVQSNGKNLRFIDKSSGVDYLSTDTLTYFASIRQGDREFDVSNITQEGEILTLYFGDSQVTAELEIVKNPDYLTLKVVSVKGETDLFKFIDIPLKLKGMENEPFGACVLAMNLNTHVVQLPVLQTRLTAKAYEHTGMVGAMITLLGLSQEKLLPVIRDVVKNAKDIPFSDKGGAWALNEKEGYSSYLMSHGVTEENVDEWIEMCQSLGFNQIDHHGGGSFFKFGSFEINKEKYPDGWDSFKRVNERLHEAGITSLLHTYSYFIDKSSFYITPVPSEDLGYFRTFTLAEDIGPEDNEIVVNESTAEVSTKTGFWVQNSITLKVGNELVEFTGVTKSPPYKFTGCKRGALGTTASSHSANVKSFHLMELFGRFVPGADTKLFSEIAKRTAEIVDECKFDGIYFDAADGSKLFNGHYCPVKIGCLEKGQVVHH